MKKFQMETEHKPVSTRPEIPADGIKGGRPYHKSGEMPKGGFQSMWCFDGSHNTKSSPTVGNGQKIY